MEKKRGEKILIIILISIFVGGIALCVFNYFGMLPDWLLKIIYYIELNSVL